MFFSLRQTVDAARGRQRQRQQLSVESEGGRRRSAEQISAELHFQTRQGHLEDLGTAGNGREQQNFATVPNEGKLRLGGAGSGGVSSSIFTAPRADVRNASLNHAPVSLFLDVDGTLLDLAERPGDVVTPAGLSEALAKTDSKLDGALALISGRPIEELDRLFEPLRLRASGVHGAQMRFHPLASPVSAAKELPDSLWMALLQAVSDFPGAFAENKRFSFTVHYRLAAEKEAPLREAVMRLVEAAPRIPLEVLNAHCAIEVKAPGPDKGRAIDAFLCAPPFLGRTPIFVGDDITDEAGFAVVSARGGFAYSVGGRRPGAIGAFADPGEVRDWLAAFAQGNATA